MKFKELEDSYYLFSNMLRVLKDRSATLKSSWEYYLHVEISLSRGWEEDIPVDLYPLPLEIREYAYLGMVKAVDESVLLILLKASYQNLDIIDEVAKRLPEGAFGREYEQAVINDYFSNGKVGVGL